MNRGTDRRRLRLRRKRKGERLGPKLGLDRPYTPTSAESRSRPSRDIPDEAVEVVGEFGCCLIEAVGSAAILLALLSIPAYRLIY